MSQPIPTLYEALKAEGFELPRECVDVVMEMKADSMHIISYRCYIDPEMMGILGRAFQRMAGEDK